MVIRGIGEAINGHDEGVSDRYSLFLQPLSRANIYIYGEVWGRIAFASGQAMVMKIYDGTFWGWLKKSDIGCRFALLCIQLASL